MSWAAIEIQRTRRDRLAIVVVRFQSDDPADASLVLEYQDLTPTQEKLQDFARKAIAQLEGVEAFVDASPGPSAPIDLTPPEVKPPTQAELDRVAYHVAEFKLAMLQQDFARKVELKVVAADDATYLAAIATAEAEAKALFKPEFIDVAVAAEAAVAVALPPSR
jgi:hypothetical protein